MFERRPLLGVALALVVVVLGVIEVQNVVYTVRSQSRLRARIIHGIESDLARSRPRLAQLLAQAPAGPWEPALDEALRQVAGTAEAELFDASGRLLAARPRASPVTHALAPGQLKSVPAGGALTIGPLGESGSRLLTYAPFVSSPRLFVLRLGSKASDLVDDLRERQRLLVVHGFSLLVLMAVATLALRPRVERVADRGEVPEVFAEAMARLRDQREALTQHHEEERHRMELEIQGMEAMARAGELTAGIAHEVRNGLGTILGYARLIEHEGDAGTAGEAAVHIRQECEVLEGVVRRFMEFVKRESLRIESFDLGRLLSRVLGREGRARSEVSATLDSGEIGEVVGDEQLLERAFENLTRNALEAAGEGGHVTIRARRDDGAVVVTIEDDGPGLPPGWSDVRPFFTTKPGGLGLGLPLALKIVHLHGGSLTLRPGAARGVVARVDLPLERTRNSEPGAES